MRSRARASTGLKLLKDAAARHGLPIVTELMDVRMLDTFLREGVDVIQIGTRNMQNFDLLKEVGKVDVPVILKRGMSATISEWLMAAEYIAAGGNHRIILCERGIRTFETAYRNVLDVTAIPMLKRETHLPVIVDPSHAGGKAWLVSALASAAVAAGADGLLVEIHPNPPEAWCDADQALTPDEFPVLMRKLGRRRAGRRAAARRASRAARGVATWREDVRSNGIGSTGGRRTRVCCRWTGRSRLTRLNALDCAPCSSCATSCTATARRSPSLACRTWRAGGRRGLAACRVRRACGKSTLLHVLAGLLSPTQGCVSSSRAPTCVRCREGERDRWRGRTVGLVPQRLHLSAPLERARQPASRAVAARACRVDDARINALLRGRRAWRTSRSATRASCRRARRSASPSRARWSIARRCCSPTSRPRTSTTRTPHRRSSCCARRRSKPGATLVVASHDGRVKSLLPVRVRRCHERTCVSRARAAR